MRIEIYPSEVEALRRLDRVLRLYHYKKENPDPPSIGQQLSQIAQVKKNG